MEKRKKHVTNVAKKILAVMLAVISAVSAGIVPLNAQAAVASTAADTQGVVAQGSGYVGSSAPKLQAATSCYPKRAFTQSIVGSTGWAGISSLKMYSSASTSGTVVKTLSRGTAFRIIKASTSSNFWQVTLSNGTTGYVQWKYCMINLPDVLPEIEYQITNASGSIFKTTLTSSASATTSIPGVTGEKLYSAGKLMNSKLGYKEYLVPMMFTTACKLSLAYYNIKQISSDYNLRIYDSYRPYTVSQSVYSAFKTMYDGLTSTQQKCITTDSYGNTWTLNWLVSATVSSHNAGVGMDITITYQGTAVSMPTGMHVLTLKAAKYKSGYKSGSSSQKPANFASTMNENAKLLDAVMQGYSFTYKGTTYKFIDTGLDALSSEWWHFQDNEAFSGYSNNYKSVVTSSNSFQVTTCLSRDLD